MRCGLLRPDPSREKAIWSDFWAKFEKAQPEHEVFSLARAGTIQLSNAAAVVYHGDEGRGRKKQPFLVTSFKSCLGRGLAPGLRASKAKVFPSTTSNKNAIMLGRFTPRTCFPAFCQSTFTERMMNLCKTFSTSEQIVLTTLAGMEWLTPDLENVSG